MPGIFSMRGNLVSPGGLSSQDKSVIFPSCYHKKCQQRKDMALTKDKLITRLQTQLGLTKPESRQAVEQLLLIIKDTLAAGEDLLISGFGKFCVRQKNERRGRNPQSKENLLLPARKVLVFRASGVLRRRITAFQNLSTTSSR